MHAEEPMSAADIDEPPRGYAVVDMLDALPPEEREFYSSEENVIGWCGKSSELFFEIQERYFVLSAGRTRRT